MIVIKLKVRLTSLWLSLCKHFSKNQCSWWNGTWESLMGRAMAMIPACIVMMLHYAAWFKEFYGEQIYRIFTIKSQVGEFSQRWIECSGVATTFPRLVVGYISPYPTVVSNTYISGPLNWYISFQCRQTTRDESSNYNVAVDCENKTHGCDKHPPESHDYTRLPVLDSSWLTLRVPMQSVSHTSDQHCVKRRGFVSIRILGSRVPPLANSSSANASARELGK